jgi:hypothetical protein
MLAAVVTNVLGVSGRVIRRYDPGGQIPEDWPTWLGADCMPVSRQSRNLAVSVYDLIPSQSEQLEMFSSKSHAVADAMDKINDKYDEFVICQQHQVAYQRYEKDGKWCREPGYAGQTSPAQLSNITTSGG